MSRLSRRDTRLGETPAASAKSACETEASLLERAQQAAVRVVQVDVVSRFMRYFVLFCMIHALIVNFAPQMALKLRANASIVSHP